MIELPSLPVEYCSVPLSCASMVSAVRAMSKTAFQQVGLSGLPCPVPLAAVRGVTVAGSGDGGESGCCDVIILR